ncbi:CXXC motif containing zinc binding protein-like [Haliotis rufescens]|uniref:CXXC motif containing zinc binding protein-like n=1 Tax=Haliotis rufescens TaxID=6454 RepID=UPI001EB07348|nr:CXXC motif containing zinc binding protein-like [Haliotis rufescens]
MVKISLQISAQLENVTNVKAVDEDFRWYLKLRCHNCGEETPDFIYCTLTDSSPLTGGRGSASVVLKCKLCKRENSIDILKETLSSYTVADAGKFKSVVTFDCRGVEPIDFSPRVGWSVEGEETSTVFSDINLGEKEWYDYDEKGQTSVSITEFQHKFVTSR